MKITILGGAGFIGHSLALSLAARGDQVTVVDSLGVNNILTHRDRYARFIEERLDLLRAAEVPVVIQDARDYHALSRILSDLNPQVIVHAAAVAHAGQSNKDPHTTFDHSLRTLENTLDWARSSQSMEHFIFLSSSMVYGDFQTDPVTEDHPLNSIGIYGALKVAAERIVVAYNQVFGLPYTIIRPSALYGPRCVSRRVVQVFIEDAMAGKPLILKGARDLLDFTYIDDLVDGLLLTIDNPASKGETFNLTYGQARSVERLADLVLRYFPASEIRFLERDALMPHRGALSIGKAQHLLGYAPRYSLEGGVLRYIDWYAAHVVDRLVA